MDNKKRMLLQFYQKDIIADLDVKYIIDDLFTKDAISREDFDHIFELVGRAEQTRFLIDTLIHNGNNNSFETFVESLSKDHRWLWEKFTIEAMNEPVLNESFEDNLSRGDVPRLPEHYVQRKHLEDTIVAKLKLLSRHKILAMHGMSGSGKTVIAISALRNNPNIVTDNFGGVVFWVNFGNVKTEDDIISQQNKLRRKASTYLHRDSYMNSSISMSSIGSNVENQSLGSNEWTWQELRDVLKPIFLEPVLKETLLILDEVNDRQCVEAFDIGCKILVTTRDTNVVSKFQPEIIMIENAFQESESLQLFASCLGVDVSDLPRQAKKIHDICKGGPFHIALIGAQLAENKERLVDDPSHWNYYISKLAKKEFVYFYSLSRRSDQFNPMKPIEMCINSLPDNILSLFKMLAVLPDNVKVSTNVLKVLWEKQENDVERIMKQLKNKSLISELYDAEQKNYLYEIHDLIMNCLRSYYNTNELNKLHNDFLNSYGYDNLNKPNIELVDDGYIPFYIGYHIYHSGNVKSKWILFNKLFLNLNFIGNKVRLTGPADVIMDFQIYGDKICLDAVDRELSNNIVAYLRTHGNDLYKYYNTDIVQSILQHVSTGILYQRAHEIAQDCCANNQLYLEFSHEQNVEEIKYSTIDVKKSVSCVCFLGDYVLVGTNEGVIKIFYIYTNKLKKELLAFDKSVKWIDACPINFPKIAALSDDGVIRFWYIDDLDEQEPAEKSIEEESEDGVFNENCDNPVTISPRIGVHKNCQWANNEEVLITHTTKKIISYNSDGSILKVFDLYDNNSTIEYCLLSNDDKYIITESYVDNKFKIEIIDMKRDKPNNRVLSFSHVDPVVQILNVAGHCNKILALNKKEVFELEWRPLSPSYSNAGHKPYTTQKIITNNELKDNLVFVSGTVNKSGSLLFISTNDSRIICIDLKTNLHIFDLDNRRGNVVSMAVSELWYDEFTPGPDVLLSGTGDIENFVKIWYLDTAYISQVSHKHRKVRLTTKFDVNFAIGKGSPATSSGYITPPSDYSVSSTPRRNQSFIMQKDMEKKSIKKTTSLDRHSLKPLNLKGISNGNDDSSYQPLLAVVDDKNNIQIMRGRKVLTEITVNSDDQITAVRISPCNQYIFFGQSSGTVKKYIIRSKEIKLISDIYSSIQYLNFVNPSLLMVSGKNRCLMAYRHSFEGDWKLHMLQQGDTHLGSQEILNDIQGTKKRNGQSDTVSNTADSEPSTSSKERLFPGHESKGRLCKGSSLVECFWIEEMGMLTVENNATVKLWDHSLKLNSVLNGRQTDVYINCAAFKKNILIICDDYGKFQTFEIKDKGTGDVILQTIQEYKLNNTIVSCALTDDGLVLAMGLNTGYVVVWNVQAKSQVSLLKGHKTKVKACIFSPVPDKLYRSGSAAQSPIVNQSFHFTNTDNNDNADQTPLVLVTMATEIIWWNISYVIKMKPQKPGFLRSRGRNVLTPVTSPIESRTEINAGYVEKLSDKLENLNICNNHFFGDINDSWEVLWKRKVSKHSKKGKEILSCIKLSGMNAKRLCCDDKFSCFVTVDNPGHVHIMSLMRHNLNS